MQAKHWVWILLHQFALLFRQSSGITCYVCESHRDYRCLDPFDDRPFVQVNCDNANFVRDLKPIFCEKRTEIVDGVYVTTRGCSSQRYEDVALYVDHRGGAPRCVRRGHRELCLCDRDSCNSAPPGGRPHLALLVALLAAAWLRRC